MIVGVGTIVFGVVLIGVAVAVAIFAVDWPALKALRAERKKLASVHRDAEQGG
jgi:hypothetical protein